MAAAFSAVPWAGRFFGISPEILQDPAVCRGRSHRVPHFAPSPSVSSAPAPSADETESVGGLLGRGSVVQQYSLLRQAAAEQPSIPAPNRPRHASSCGYAPRQCPRTPNVLYKGEPCCRYFLVDSLHGSEIVLKSDSEKPQLKTAVEKSTKTTGQRPNSGQRRQKVAILV